MDLLFKRYASPYLLIDEMISAGAFSQFVDTVLQTSEEEKIWNYFLTKVFDKSYNDFKNELQSQAPVSNINVETTINNSFEIMQCFVPVEVSE